MRNIKEYKAPKAQITEFECADVITVSNMANSIGESGTPEFTENGYVHVGSKSWSDIKGN